MSRLIAPFIAFVVGFALGVTMAEKRHTEETDKSEYIHR